MRASTTSRTSRSTCPATPSSSSPGCPAPGKSSLAFDTIFAEGQRRYVESLSAYARQFLGQMDKPDVDFIEGLSPAVSIDQKSTSRNPRSTVGTITEVYDYLRLLFARAGRPHCPVCGEPISRQTPQQIVDRVLEMDEGTRFQVLAPVVRGRKGEYAELFRELQTKGYSRARVDGETVSLAEPPKLDKKYKHTIDVVVDRLAVKPSAKRRLTDSVETALGLAGGLVILDFVDLPEKAPDRERRFSEKLACPNEHPLSMDELEPRSFSFNSPYGACPECTGLGTRLEVDPELIVPDDEKSLGEGAVAPWAAGTTSSEYFQRLLEALAEDLGFRMDTPVAEAAGPGQGRRPARPRLPGARRSTGTATAGCAATTPGSRARSRSSSAGTPRPSPTGAGSATRATCARCRARCARAPGSSPSRSRCSSADARSPTSCRLPIRECDEFLRSVELTDRERQIAERVHQGDPRPARLPARRRARLPLARAARPAPCPAARRSGSGWPPRSAPAWSASSTSSTSRPSACTSATTTG